MARACLAGRDPPESRLRRGRMVCRSRRDFRTRGWRLRHADGVCPDQRRKARVKALSSEYFKAAATWPSAMSVFASSSHAISKRISLATCRNARPSVRRCRFKVRRCIEKRRATVAAEQVSLSSSVRSTRRRSSVSGPKPWPDLRLVCPAGGWHLHRSFPFGAMSLPDQPHHSLSRSACLIA